MKRWLPWVVGLAPLYLIRLSFGGVPTTLYELVILLTVVVAVGTGAIDYARLWRRLSPAWRWGIGFTVVGGLLGVVLSVDRRAAIGELKAFVLEPVLVALLVLGTAEPEDLPRLLLGYFASATIVGGLSLLSMLSGPSAAVGVAGDGRLLGIYGLEANASPNYLAFWLAPAVALSIAWIGTGWGIASGKQQVVSSASRWLIGVATLVSFAALIGTDSRAGIASAIVAGAVALIAYYRSTLVEFRFAQGVGWLLLIGLVLFGVAVVQPDFSQNAATGGRISSSNNIRWEIWRTTGRLLTQSPTAVVGGLGLADYQTKFGELTKGQVNYPEFITPRALTPHNLWLNAWVNLGLLGLTGTTLLMILAKLALWRAEPTHKAALVTAVLLCIALQGLVDTPNWKNDTSALFWVALASAVQLAQPVRKQS